jgi:hypothetical protein
MARGVAVRLAVMSVSDYVKTYHVGTALAQNGARALNIGVLRKAALRGFHGVQGGLLGFS